jgi:predicted small metal-binding protein
MTSGVLRVRCACGWEASGDEDELVKATQEHGRRMHNMVATRDEVLSMVMAADDPAGGSADASPADSGT